MWFCSHYKTQCLRFLARGNETPALGQSPQAQGAHVVKDTSACKLAPPMFLGSLEENEGELGASELRRQLQGLLASWVSISMFRGLYIIQVWNRFSTPTTDVLIFINH